MIKREHQGATRREFVELGAGTAAALAVWGLSARSVAAGPEGAAASRAGSRLYSPGRIGKMTIPNRLVRSATWEAAASNGQVTETYTAIHTGLAAGGVGAVICGFMAGLEAEAIPI
jgi:hypothetical protein